VALELSYYPYENKSKLFMPEHPEVTDGAKHIDCTAVINSTAEDGITKIERRLSRSYMRKIIPIKAVYFA
jgi:hypothetical protein